MIWIQGGGDLLLQTGVAIPPGVMHRFSTGCMSGSGCFKLLLSIISGRMAVVLYSMHKGEVVQLSEVKRVSVSEICCNLQGIT